VARRALTSGGEAVANKLSGSESALTSGGAAVANKLSGFESAQPPLTTPSLTFQVVAEGALQVLAVDFLN
jgi:hypothetical protein